MVFCNRMPNRDGVGIFLNDPSMTSLQLFTLVLKGVSEWEVLSTVACWFCVCVVMRENICFGVCVFALCFGIYIPGAFGHAHATHTHAPQAAIECMPTMEQPCSTFKAADESFMQTCENERIRERAKERVSVCVCSVCKCVLGAFVLL